MKEFEFALTPSIKRTLGKVPKVSSIEVLIRPGLFTIFIFSLKSRSLSLTSHMNQHAQKLTDLGITSLLFDLNYKFINGSFASSSG